MPGDRKKGKPPAEITHEMAPSVQSMLDRHAEKKAAVTETAGSKKYEQQPRLQSFH